jgi:hypothetical protein
VGTTLQFNPAAIEDIYAAVDALFEDELGPDIYEDAYRLCPVFGGENSTATPESIAASPNAEPGALRDSLEYHLNGHDLIVSATGSDERSYAYYVEEGHMVVAWGRPMGYAKEAQPFLRPALYSVRAA